MSLEGRVALVTGGSRGIGRAIALGLAQDGADVAVNYRRDDEAAAETVAAIQKLGRKAKAYAASVDSWDEDEAMVRQVVEDFGSIGILVNNAGIASRGNTVVDTDPEEMRRVVRTHVFGSQHMCHLLVPKMRDLPRGDVVMISSGAAQSFGARGAPYNMAKAGMEALAYTLAKEEREFGIHVNVVAPGLVETDMGNRLMRARRNVASMRELDAESPFGRVCQPEDIANAVVFLCSEEASYVTGQRITVNGGGF